MTNYYANRIKSDRRRTRRRMLLSSITVIFLFFLLLFGYLGYRMVYKPNVWLNNETSVSINIKKGTSWEEVKQILYKNGTILHRGSFEQLAVLMKYPEHIKSGHYLITAGMSNRMLLNKLKAGKQDPVKLVFNNIRTKEELAGHISLQIDVDSVTLLALLNDAAFTEKLGFSPQNIISMFIPNTYEIYWNVSAEKFMERMQKEYKAFWNESREAKLKTIKLSELQAITLASIVEKESNQNAEKPDIAGVYMNRLQQGWLLQADPTLVYALGDFTIKRVLNVYKTVNSPYNTYMYLGLPPGPICLPSIASIDAVLNYRRHNYMFFCAREDFSGFHNFAVTLNQHMVNAEKYQQALDKQGIMK